MLVGLWWQGRRVPVSSSAVHRLLDDFPNGVLAIPERRNPDCPLGKVCSLQPCHPGYLTSRPRYGLGNTSSPAIIANVTPMVIRNFSRGWCHLAPCTLGAPSLHFALAGSMEVHPADLSLLCDVSASMESLWALLSIHLAIAFLEICTQFRSTLQGCCHGTRFQLMLILPKLLA